MSLYPVTVNPDLFLFSFLHHFLFFPFIFLGGDLRLGGFDMLLIDFATSPNSATVPTVVMAVPARPAKSELII
jgi:hypothetical protein